ncbi:Uncharacterised protein [Mycobacteroides abscessus subsp. massiliense]|uniref:hypothetical protein n=1 Tax=Mycobacteroides abscessus TaxID=36809 RepID=UPI0009A78095|nr:hypothetical protein [Mycobacteroides abscessus]SKE69809.1 Uncharacterised protein [Mycobacteroides abscessus subsp. massiliense]SKH81222.1 Uncharacterised protein [Mycobacteroides abscessus subsp. massiliense]SKI34546.1 Uncharacterised protein [Mycobacteroides abscessus subsp. massiliense]SKJ36069.1 Uncharacterised protein [Mycobacteroides abscessus subsp. massiliense]SKK23862.1 Uncharacterised protein [Mycobacteroides abscessus subsp. massiliense]
MTQPANRVDIGALHDLVTALGRAQANGRSTTPIIRELLTSLGYQLGEGVDAELSDDNRYEAARVAAARAAVLRRRGAASRARRLAREAVAR